MKAQKPVNQKSIYHSYSDLYDKLMNEELPIGKAEVAGKLLDGMNRTYALELKRAELENQFRVNSLPVGVRTLELKEFDELPIDLHKSNA